jgi:hypothetical protein
MRGLALRHEKPFDGNFDDEFMKDCLVKSRRFGTSPLKIRLGSITDAEKRPLDVRFAPQSGHRLSGCRAKISPAVSLSKRKGAVIGRAAAHRSLKKLNQVCDRRI